MKLPVRELLPSRVMEFASSAQLPTFLDNPLILPLLSLSVDHSLSIADSSLGGRRGR